MSKWYNNPEGKSETGEHRDALPTGRPRGRGAGLNPAPRFESVRLHVLGDHLDSLAAQQDASSPKAQGLPALGDSSDPQPLDPPAAVRTQIFPDRTQTIINKVQSPDMGFDWTLNPYRGCEHGCIYCYARPYHEYLGFSSGIDFETKIMAKFDAPKLLVEELAAPKWKAETIVMSGITDCWQPIEEELRISRACLQVLAECRQPVAMITRNRRILRDLDLIQELARHHAATVAVSFTNLDNHLSSIMEPRASSPSDRLKTIKTLADAGIPVTAMIAPVIPGLTDAQIPSLLKAAADNGATAAGLCMLRLPWQNKALFLDWLNQHFPDRAAHVESLVRQMHGGKLYDSAEFSRRGGSGQIAQQITDLFHVFAAKYNLNRSFPPLSSASFRRPATDEQLALFDG